MDANSCVRHYLAILFCLNFPTLIVTIYDR